MAMRTVAALIQKTRTAKAEYSHLTDRDLLTRFAQAGDQAAFAVVVKRHAGMVHEVCRRVLHSHVDAEDACQAVFLILTRKVKAVQWQTSTANWLYATARKVAHNARVASTRRTRRENIAGKPDLITTDDSLIRQELEAALDEELERLPSRYREPLVLCYLEGLTGDEAAVRLGVSVGTLRRQLERGRKKLADALNVRGCSLGMTLLVAMAASATGAVQLQLQKSILASVGGSPSASVASLATTGILTQSKLAKLVVLLVLGVAASGVGFVSMVGTSPMAREAIASGEDTRRKSEIPGEERDPLPKPEESAKWKTLATLEGHKDDVVALAFGVDQMMSAGKDGKLVLWDSNTGKEIRTSKYDTAIGPMENMSFTPDGKSLFLRYGDQIALWEIAKKTFPKAGIGGGIPVATLVGPGEGYTIVLRRVENKKSILVQDVARFAAVRDEILGFGGMKTVGSCDTAHDVVQVAVDQKRSLLAGAMSSHEVAIYNFASKELSVLKGSKQDVIAMEFSPDSKLFASAGKEGTVLIRSVDGWKELANLKGHEGAVNSIAFSPDSKQLATAGDDKTISIWDVSSGKRIVVLKGHTGVILRVAFGRDGKVLASAGKDKTVRLWEFTK